MKRTLIACLLALLVPVHGWAQMAVEQEDYDSFNTGTTYAYNYPVTPTAGNLVIIAVAGAIRTVSSIAGTATTYTINGANTNNAGAGFNISLWKAIFSGSDTSATITMSGGVPDTQHICFLEVSNAASDQSGSTANGSSNEATTTHNSGSVTPPTANNVIVSAMWRTTGTWTEDSGLTNVTTGTGAFTCAYLTQTSATAQENNVTSTDNEYSAMRIGAFAGTGGGSSGPPVGSLMLLGVGR